MSLATPNSVARTKPPRPIAATSGLMKFYAIVAAVQGVHVIEHIVQLIQVYGFGVASERAFGLLGYIFNFSGTAEWMHLVFNAAYLATIYVLFVRLYELYEIGQIARWKFWTFAIGGAGLESWHMTEHIVIIYHVIRNHGCPCPGIGDQALNVSDIQLHFVYNTITYIAVVIPFIALRRRVPPPE